MPDGRLIWKKKPSNRVKIGQEVGYLTKIGYRQITLFYKPYYSHRIIYLMHNGHLPEQVDHINGDRSDNRIENLRECTNSQNSRNRGSSRNNTSGYKGVSFSKNNKKWIAQITFNRRLIYLGYTDTKEEAALLYNEAAIKYHGKFAFLNKL